MGDPLSALMSAWKEGINAGSLATEADVVTYQIFLDSVSASVSASGALDSDLLELGELKTQILTLVQPVIADYIWQNEPFSLTIVPTGTDSAYPGAHLCGRSNFGDNMEDEWFIVYLLYHISRNLPHVSIRVVDNDGQFLLIEVPSL